MKLKTLFIALFLIAVLLVVEMQLVEKQSSSKRETSSVSEKYFTSEDIVLSKIKEIKAKPLKEGECFSDPNTKTYFSNVKSSNAGSYTELKSHIDLTQLENTAQSEFYFCRVTCSVNNRYASFWTTLTDAPAKHDDNNGFICHGILIQQVPIPGTSLTTLGPVVSNFSVFDLPEIFPKLKEINFKLSMSAQAELDAKTALVFVQIAQAYISSSSSEMIEAGKILDQIAHQRNDYKAVLDKYVLMIHKNHGKPTPDFSRDYFVMINIIQQARYLLY